MFEHEVAEVAENPESLGTFVVAFVGHFVWYFGISVRLAGSTEPFLLDEVGDKVHDKVRDQVQGEDRGAGRRHPT